MRRFALFLLLLQQLPPAGRAVQHQVLRVDGERRPADEGRRLAPSLEEGEAVAQPLLALYGVGAGAREAEATAELLDPYTQQSFRGVFSQSFLVVAVAELFDKTWFVAVLFSLNHGMRVALAGSLLALYLHVVIAAGLGMVISKFFFLSTLHFITAGVFGLLTALYLREFAVADVSANALEERSEEAKESLGSGADKPSVWWQRFASCFIAVFVAEWGDRTQVAMITLHSSMPLLPVCLGSLVAFTALSANAVLVAAMLEGVKLSERFICGASAVSFLVFAILALLDGFEAKQLEQAAALAL